MKNFHSISQKNRPCFFATDKKDRSVFVFTKPSQNYFVILFRDRSKVPAVNTRLKRQVFTEENVLSQNNFAIGFREAPSSLSRNYFVLCVHWKNTFILKWRFCDKVRLKKSVKMKTRKVCYISSLQKKEKKQKNSMG